MLTIPSRWWCLILALLFVVPQGAKDDPAIKEFKTYFAKYAQAYSKAGKNVEEKKRAVVTMKEAVISLKGSETPQVIDALMPVLKFDEPDLTSAVITVFSNFKTRPPVDALLAVLGKERSEGVLSALLQAYEIGKYTGTVEMLKPMLESSSWEVRRHSALALLTIKDPAAVAAVVGLCTDKEAAVRCTVLDGLAGIESDAVVKPALAALNDPVWQVRASAIHALGIVRKSEALDPLVAALAKEQGRLKDDLVATLENLTGNFFGKDLEKWQELAKRANGHFPVPSKEMVAQLRKDHLTHKGPTTDGGFGGKKGGDDNETGSNLEVKYHGIETPSRSILFVIDVSGSMESLVIEKDRFADGNYPSMSRIDIVKTELARTIDRLEPTVNFNIISFATDVKFWKPRLQPANPGTKAAAVEWAHHLEAIGGASKDDLARAGLVASSGGDGGQTNTWGALTSALGVASASLLDKDYAVPVDTVFFLSDGRPSTGTYVDTDDILRELKKVNELRKVVIHTIAIGEFQKDFMKNLADQNGGIFVDLGR